jgi:hypothetical protein
MAFHRPSFTFKAFERLTLDKEMLVLNVYRTWTGVTELIHCHKIGHKKKANYCTTTTAIC